MNNLIEIKTSENQEPVIDEKELRFELMKCLDFKELFIKVCELKDAMQTDGLRMLLKILNGEWFYLQYGTDAIVHLRDVVLMEKCLFHNTKNNEKSEKEMQKEIVKNFKRFFPQYKYKGQEIKVDNIGRIDILAEDKKTKRPVIIELKKGYGNPNKQLLAYSAGYKNPILIGITEMSSNFLKGITYYKYKDGKMIRS